MATSTAQYAAGDMYHYALGEESRKFGGRRRRTVYSAAQRPLFATEVDFKAGKVFPRARKGMLVLYGTDLLVVDVMSMAAADAPDGSTADVMSYVLRWINYNDILDISFASPTTIRVEHGDTSDRPKVRGMPDAFPTALDDSSAPAPYKTASNSSLDALPTNSFNSAASGSGPSYRVTSDTFTLKFADAAAAQQAAAALLFQQAQFSAVQHWLRLGLHAGVKCDLVSVMALPLRLAGEPRQQGLGKTLSRSPSVLPPHMLYSTASGLAPRGSLTAGALAATQSGSVAGVGSAAAAAVAAAAAAGPYPWGEAAAGGPPQDWGCLLPLPAGWGPLLQEAADASASSDKGEEPGVSAEELTAPVLVQRGPRALQVTISTPLGAAVATITPQLVRAALTNRNCREVLALPLHSSSSSPSAGPPVAFSWQVQGSLGTAAAAPPASNGGAADSDASPFGGGSVHAYSGLSAEAADYSVFAGSSNSGGGMPLSYTSTAYASVTIRVVRTPATANTSAVRKKQPKAAAVEQASPLPTMAEEPEAGTLTTSSSGGSNAAPAVTSSSSGQGSSNTQLQLAACVLLAAMAVVQCAGQPVLLTVQLLLLALLASTKLGSSQQGSAAAGLGTQSSSKLTSMASEEPFAAAAAAPAPAPAEQSELGSEDGTCCGWSIELVAADLCSTPSRHLQLQVTLAKASRSMARLRMRIASISLRPAQPSLLPVLPSDEEEEEEEGLPVLVSDPEPDWLTVDMKQRFIMARNTLEEARQQALQTHKFRSNPHLRDVLRRPCPALPLLRKHMPIYLALDQNHEGHAVVVVKVGSIKALCEELYHTPAGTPGKLSVQATEHTLAFVFEYLMQVAAPKPLPGGYEVMIYDLAGLKVTYGMTDLLNLFKLLIQFVQLYPERLHIGMLLNTPIWFNAPLKALTAFLDDDTRSRIQVAGSAKSILPTIAHLFGGLHNVPVSWGGSCSMEFEDYPSHTRMMDFWERLNRGEQPLDDLRG